MKLNINYEQKPTTPLPKKVYGYSSPIGTWEVTTEGDCEGRSIKNLGCWTGHVAEIAFHLANDCYYTLKFENLTGTRTAGKKVPKNNKTNRDHVWISFNIYSNTWNMSPEDRAQFVAELLDADDQLYVYGRYGGVQYHAGACLVLKN